MAAPARSSSIARAARWAALAAATAVAALALDAAGLPSSLLFAALLAGLVASLLGARLALPGWSFAAAQAITGVALGAYLQSSSLSAVAGDWLPVTLVAAATLAISLAAGAVLARATELDPPTAALGMVAGGASGIVGISGELGADDRLVAFMQYLRVLLVVVLTPILVGLAFPGHHSGAAAPQAHEPVLGDLTGWLVTAGAAAVGVLAARAVRVTAGTLLGPMVLAGAVTLAGGHFAVPPVLREGAFAVIGMQVGLRFTLETVRLLGRLLVPVVLAILAVLAACFGLAAVLALTTSVSLLDAYLATTPGGLYAVLAIAFGAGANTTFIIAAQGLRLVVMVLLAPLAVRRLVSPRRRQVMAGTPSGSRSSAD